MTESHPFIDIYGVKRDLDKKALVHTVTYNTESGVSSLNPGDSVFLYTPGPLQNFVIGP